ncbi:hypothetical protein J6A31_02790 [bacterium]|nr:hypothetical protein [bacterium]
MHINYYQKELILYIILYLFLQFGFYPSFFMGLLLLKFLGIFWYNPDLGLGVIIIIYLPVIFFYMLKIIVPFVFGWKIITGNKNSMLLNIYNNLKLQFLIVFVCLLLDFIFYFGLKAIEKNYDWFIWSFTITYFPFFVFAFFYNLFKPKKEKRVYSLRSIIKDDEN